MESSPKTTPRGIRLCYKYFSFDNEIFEETCGSWVKDIANSGANVHKVCGTTEESNYGRSLQKWYNGIRNRLAEIWAALNNEVSINLSLLVQRLRFPNAQVSADEIQAIIKIENREEFGALGKDKSHPENDSMCYISDIVKMGFKKSYDHFSWMKIQYLNLLDKVESWEADDCNCNSKRERKRPESVHWLFKRSSATNLLHKYEEPAVCEENVPRLSDAWNFVKKDFQAWSVDSKSKHDSFWISLTHLNDHKRDYLLGSADKIWDQLKSWLNT